MAAAPLITVRDDGLYCDRGAFYIDPWNPVECAVITHAHADHAHRGSTLYHCSAASEQLLDRRLGDRETRPNLAPHPWGEPFELGEAKVSFHPAGHILGSAQVRVEIDGEVWVVSGDFKRAPDPSCEPFEIVECDTFITEATFALPIYVWDDGETVARKCAEWIRENKEKGKCSILFGYSLGKTQRMLAHLKEYFDETVYVHGAIEPLTRIYREAGIEMLPTQKIVDQPDDFDWGGKIVMSPPSGYTDRYLKRFKPVSTAFSSGWMRVRGIRRRRGYDRGFVLSDHADWPALLRTIEETGCTRVLATHGRTDVLVRYLEEIKGIEAAALETLYVGEQDDG